MCVESGWMDVCYPFRENYDLYSKPEGVWDNFEESIEEAKEYERTGQFIVLTSAAGAGAAEDSSSEEEEHVVPKRRRTVAKRKRPAHSSDDDTNFGGSDDDEYGGSSGKRGGRRLKRGDKASAKARSASAAGVRNVRATKDQKLFAREIFAIIKAIEKEIKEKNLDGALALLKKFDPKSVVKRVNKDGLTIDAPGPYANIETQVVHISRLGKFVHGLAKHHEEDILGPYARMLYSHLRSNARREFALPDDVEAYMANQAHISKPDNGQKGNTNESLQENALNSASDEHEAANTNETTQMDVTASENAASTAEDTSSTSKMEIKAEDTSETVDAAPVSTSGNSMEVASNAEQANSTNGEASHSTMQVDA